MQPIVYLVEDNKDTQALFAAAIPEEWTLRIFDDPIYALSALVDEKPAIIVSDQIMPKMNGDEFLVLTRTLSPYSIRIIQTGHHDERLLLDSIRKCQLNDFIKKPWTPELMRTRMEAALDLFNAGELSRSLSEEARMKEVLLNDLTSRFQAVSDELSTFKRTSLEMRREIECWAPPAIVAALKSKQLPKSGSQFVITVAFSIPPDVTLPEVLIDGRPLRVQLVSFFSDAILKHGGWRESGGSAGARITSAYFGLLGNGESQADNALAAALEFKTAVENMYNTAGTSFPCLIAVHAQENVDVNVTSTLINTTAGPVAQKNLEPFGINYETIRNLIDVQKPLGRAAVVVSGPVKQHLRNAGWGLQEAISPSASTGRAFFVRQELSQSEASTLLMPTYKPKKTIMLGGEGT